jgi:hypothetical protein
LRLSATRHGATASSFDVIVAATTRGNSTAIGTDAASIAAATSSAIRRG